MAKELLEDQELCAVGVSFGGPVDYLSGTVRLSHHVPGWENMPLGEMVEAEQAARLGLINRAVAPGEERAEAIALARKIASKSSHTLKVGKQAFYRQLELGLVEAYAYASEVMTENLMARDAEEGIGAFIEKRKPTWEDR